MIYTMLNNMLYKVLFKIIHHMLYKTTYMRDVNRVVPQDLIDDMLRGNEAMGGPVDGYYIGPMEVTYEVKGDNIITNGNVIPLEKFADSYEKIYPAYEKAIKEGGLHILVEYPELYYD